MSHILQPKHTKLNEKEAEELLKKLNISKAQIPKVLVNDPALPEGCEIGNVIKIERKIESPSHSSKSPNERKIDDKSIFYYRVVV